MAAIRARLIGARVAAIKTKRAAVFSPSITRVFPFWREIYERRRFDSFVVALVRRCVQSVSSADESRRF